MEGHVNFESAFFTSHLLLLRPKKSSYFFGSTLSAIEESNIYNKFVSAVDMESTSLVDLLSS